MTAEQLVVENEALHALLADASAELLKVTTATSLDQLHVIAVSAGECLDRIAAGTPRIAV